METRSIPRRALIVYLFCIIAQTRSLNYTGYQVFEIRITDLEELKLLENFIANQTSEVDVWKWPLDVGDKLNVLLKPSDLVYWRRLCTDRKLVCSVMIDDVQKLIDEEVSHSGRESPRHKRDKDTLLHRIANIYPAWDMIEQWLLDLHKDEPLTSLMTIGQTYENRTLYVIKITAATRPDQVPAMWIDGGIHAREWIVHTSMIYTIRNLVERYYNNDTIVRPLIDNMVFYIMPVMNPDGYDYSYKENRFWRKNRSPPPETKHDGYDNTTCVGVDLNRNFDIFWGQVGVATNSCYSTYPGVEPASELETQAVVRFIMSEVDRIFGFLSVHSFGQLVLTRWGYVNDTPSDNKELMQLANETAVVMTAVNDLEFLYGISPRLLYAYSGGSPDWAKAKADIKYSYSMELRDLGVFGFVLPKSHINPSGEELLQGILTLASRVKQYGDETIKLTQPPENVVTIMESNGISRLICPELESFLCLVYLVGVANWLLTI